MVREALYRVLQPQGAANKLGRPPELFELWWILLQRFLWSLTQGITARGGAFLLLSSQPLCLSKGENFNYCSFCTKGGSWYGVCLLSLDTYVAQRISESQAWVGETGKAYVYDGSSGSKLVMVPHCHLCQRMRVGKKGDRACLALKILHGINCVPLIHSDGRSGDASFWISPCTHACHYITQWEKLVVKIDQ